MREIYEKLSQYFICGDVYGAMEYMKGIPELEEVRREYIELFEEEKYIDYGIPEELERILLLYQKYFRRVFYLRESKDTAEEELLTTLKKELGVLDTNTDYAAIDDAMKEHFEKYGYNVLCGRTNGYFGPYVWKETVPVTFEVELQEKNSLYTVNMLRGFVFRSWMDYLTFGEKGTGGWTSPDGTINCVEKAYDMESESFRVSLLKHEARHSEDMKIWNDVSSEDLEYRAKLTELIYTEKTNLLLKFKSEADEGKKDDGHALASARIMREMGDISDIVAIRKRAKELFFANEKEMDEKYG